ncbi:MAG: outer membrane protein assembly factor BamE [Oligoflexia bacterium]|nr:outer membrane protein assembly factor BamE [Oligoflexia bacterium]
MTPVKVSIMALLISTLFSSCATVGKNFEYNRSRELELGKTSKSDVLKLYGSPFRVGINSGALQWSYNYYTYNAFSDTQTKDLVILFDNDGKVKHYEYNSSYEEDKVKMLAK